MTRELQVFTGHSALVLKGEALACLERVSRGKSHYSETKITVEVQTVYLIVILSRESMKFNSVAVLKKLVATWFKTVLLRTAPQQRKLSFGQPLRKTRVVRKTQAMF